MPADADSCPLLLNILCWFPLPVARDVGSLLVQLELFCSCSFVASVQEAFASVTATPGNCRKAYTGEMHVQGVQWSGGGPQEVAHEGQGCRSMESVSLWRPSCHHCLGVCLTSPLYDGGIPYPIWDTFRGLEAPFVAIAHRWLDLVCREEEACQENDNISNQSTVLSDAASIPSSTQVQLIL